jgi:hypothetical protein
MAALVLLPGFHGSPAAPAVFPQKGPEPYALIFGTVWDKSDRPVYGVPIKIRLADKKKAKWELMSDHSGEFAQRVPPGKADYVVWADIKTPKGTPKPQKAVHIENDERIDISLHLSE